jgi:flavin-dependent dehydrogenase
MRVAIIGGGVCGLYLAGKLAEKGQDVTVFEQKKKVGRQTCSGLFSERIFDYIPQSKKLIQNEIDYTLIHFPKKTIKVLFSRKFFVMSHFELDKLMARIAKQSGVKIALNHQVKSLPSGFDKVIGCDGAKSFTREALNLREPNFRLAVQGFAKEQDNSNFVETWAIKQGFIWKIPRGDEVEYGILTNPKNACILFEEFLNKNKVKKLDRTSAAMVSQGLSEPHNDAVTLCGEAMVGTKAWSGGGVVWGLRNCDLLLKHFPNFYAYQKETKRIFQREIFFSKLFTKFVYFFGFNFPYILPRKAKIDGDYNLLK